jgi:glycerol kinase
VGYWKSKSEIQANWTVDRTFEPGVADAQVRHRRGRWNEALARARDWEQHSPAG